MSGCRVDIQLINIHETLKVELCIKVMAVYGGQTAEGEGLIPKLAMVTLRVHCELASLKNRTFTTRKRSCGKVMFLHLSVILFTRERRPLKRAVHILLECILVLQTSLHCALSDAHAYPLGLGLPKSRQFSTNSVTVR